MTAWHDTWAAPLSRAGLRVLSDERALLQWEAAALPDERAVFWVGPTAPGGDVVEPIWEVTAQDATGQPTQAARAGVRLFAPENGAQRLRWRLETMAAQDRITTAQVRATSLAIPQESALADAARHAFVFLAIALERPRNQGVEDELRRLGVLT